MSWTPEFWSNLLQTIRQPFITPRDATCKFDQDWPTGLRDIQVRKCKLFVIQGLVTPKWVVLSGPKSNPSELLCLSWLQATFIMIQMNKLAWRQHFPIISLWEIFRRSRVANSVVSSPIWPTFELVRDFMHVLVTCKYKKDQIKNNREKVETSFSHYKSLGVFCCHGNQTFDPICPKTLCSLSPTPVMLHIKFDQDWPTGFRGIQVWMCGRRRTTDHWYTISSLCELNTDVLIIHKPNLTSSYFKKHINGPWKPEARNRTRPNFYACPGYQQLWWWFEQKLMC